LIQIRYKVLNKKYYPQYGIFNIFPPKLVCKDKVSQTFLSNALIAYHLVLVNMMSRNKLIAIAAIAVSGILVYAIPALPLATAQDEQVNAQDIVQETIQEIDQDIDQDQDQEQDAENNADQRNEATVDQSEENNQANVIDTGDNTATVSQAGANEAIGNKVEAEGGEAEAKGKKVKGDVEAEGGDAEAELEQEVENEATIYQDSSADDNVQTNVNTFGDDTATIDQDNIADQTAVNIGVQDQDATQDADQFDFDFQYGLTQEILFPFQSQVD
jgi:hypothetical protein